MSASTPPRVLLLDVMGTLVREPWFEDAPQFFGMTLEELYAVKHPSSWIDFEHGRIDEAEHFRTFFKDERPFDGPAFVAHIRNGYHILPGIEDLLAELHTQGIPMHALSNYPVWWQHIETDLQLSRFLKWSFVSCMTGERKPAPRAYSLPLEQLGLPASDCLFIDDRPENIAGAEAVGLPGLLFTDAKALREDLQRLGVLG
jgi:HAD superfamily hydrolase (TIGR01509 family)